MIYTRNGVPVKKFNPDMLSIALDIRRLNLKDVHEGTGITLPTLRQISNGIRQPGLEEASMLATMLSFPIGFFYRAGKREATWMCSVGDWIDDADEVLVIELDPLPAQLPLL